MFTGIIEAVGRIVSIQEEGTNIHYAIQSPISGELKIDQSVSHNGVCLTVIKREGDTHQVTAVAETLLKTNLRQWKLNDRVNLERCMPASGRFDGHIVQGHADAVGTIQKITDLKGSWQIDFEFDSSLGEIVVEKGSICVNGVSLTCFNCNDGKFSVAIIPYTWEHTIFHLEKVGNLVNLEFDIIGKYVRRLLNK